MEKPRTCASRLVHQDESTSSTIRVATRIVEEVGRGESPLSQSVVDFIDTLKAVICDDRLSVSECFMKIEEIISIFETLGSNGGTRHDFG